MRAGMSCAALVVMLGVVGEAAAENNSSLAPLIFEPGPFNSFNSRFFRTGQHLIRIWPCKNGAELPNTFNDTVFSLINNNVHPRFTRLCKARLINSYSFRKYAA